jgi:hypothetical protein
LELALELYTRECQPLPFTEVLCDLIDQAQSAEPVQGEAVEVVGWRRLDRPYELTAYPSVCAMWHGVGYPVQALYTHPADQVADDLTMVKVSRELLERLYRVHRPTMLERDIYELRALLAKSEGVKP